MISVILRVSVYIKKLPGLRTASASTRKKIDLLKLTYPLVLEPAEKPSMIFIDVALTYIFVGETDQDVPSQAPKKAAKAAPAAVPPKATTAPDLPAVSVERPKAAKSKPRPVEEEGM